MDKDKQLNLLKSKNADVSDRAAVLILKTHRNYPISTIIDILTKKHNRGLGKHTLEVLIKRSEDVPNHTIKQLLVSSRPFVRQVGCKLAGQKECEGFIDGLTKCLVDESRPTCWAAIFALRDIGGPECIKILQDAQKNHPDREEINFKFKIKRAIDQLIAK